MKSIILNIVLDKSPREVVDKIEIDFNILKSICKPIVNNKRYINKKLLDNLLLDSGVSMDYKLEFSYIKRDGVIYEYPCKIILISDQKINAPELKAQSYCSGYSRDTLYMMNIIFKILRTS